MSGDKKKQNKKRFRLVPGFIRRDFWRKFIALAFAVIVWNRVSVKLDEEKVLRRVPVDVAIPAGYVRIDDTPLKVSVTLKGSKNRLMNLSSKDVHVQVRPRSPKLGNNRIRIVPGDVSVPANVAVAMVDPDTVLVSLDRKMVKDVPVELVCSGMLLEDYAFRMAGLIPNSTNVSGPWHLVEPIKSIRTEPVILGKENVEDFDCEVKLRHSPKVSVAPNSVTAKIEIYKNHDSRAFEGVQVKPYGFLPPNSVLTFKPDKVSILVEGTKKTVELTTLEELKPFVDVSKLGKTGKWRLKVKCWLNKKEVSVKNIDPATVEVTLRKNDPGE